jgi:hypothetical protein
MPMRNRLNVVVATVVVLALGILLPSTVALASSHGPQRGHGHQRDHSHGHGHGHHGHKPPHGSLPPIDTGNAENCDFIADPGNPLCMLPFPDDYYTVADPSSPTGRRVYFKAAGMPANVLGTHVDPTPYNASDGFSPGSAILLKVPGIDSAADVRATGAVPINHIGQYRARNAPVVVIDASSGRRWPIWTEIDSTASNPSKAVLEIHPAVNFASGHRYVVALRDLSNAAGQRIEAPVAFRYYRDRVPSKQPQINARRSHFEAIFSRLDRSGIERRDLYLAWDFTVASDQSNGGRELAMRDAAFAQLGDTDLADGIPQGASPSFQVTSVETAPNPGEVARRVKGSFQVPCYLFPSCAAGGTFQLDAGGAPIQNGTWTANFDCIVPDSAVSGAVGAGRPSLYGHGLFGTASEVASSPQRSLSQEHGIVQCATDEIGMSQSDLPAVAGALQDVSRFPAIPDRLQQGLLDELFLGRAMISPTGFTAAPAFHQDGTLASGPVLDTSHLYYNGNSQGGIMGGALTAVSPDFTRASLGVPAMNYSVLLPRSVDFDQFAAILYPSYPDETARPLLLDLMQMLWDRGEPNGYAARMTDDPLPNTPPHQVLMNVAFGDHQVTVLSGGCRGADGWGRRPSAGPLRRPLAWHRRALGRSLDPPLSVHGLGDLLLGHRTGPRRPGPSGDADRHRTAALREPAQPLRRRPARSAAGRDRRAAARLRLLRRSDPGSRQLRRRALLRGELRRPVSRRWARAGDQPRCS